MVNINHAILCRLSRLNFFSAVSADGTDFFIVVAETKRQIRLPCMQVYIYKAGLRVT